MHRVSQYVVAWLNASFSVAWQLLLLLLPITSFPLLASAMGYPVVAPASLIPLVWLVLWLIFFLAKGKEIPRESVPLLFFCSAAIVASAFAFFLPVPSFKGKTILEEEITALATLAIGVTFYLVTATWITQSSDRLPNRLIGTMRLLSISGAIMLLWAGVQAVYIFLLDGQFPGWLLKFHRLFSIRDLFSTRITAFAYEPSWLANQLNILYLPFWLSATTQGWSAFPKRLWKVSVENLLLGLGILVVLLSSRIGALSCLLVMLIIVLHGSLVLKRKLQARLLTGVVVRSHRLRGALSGLISIGLVIILVGLYTIAALAIVYGLSRVDPRLSQLVQLFLDAQQHLSKVSIYQFFNRLAFAERYVYWVTGWRIFSLYPILGVGLGNAGFFFHTELPTYGWNLPEVMDYYYRASYLPNIKSFWIRLLAETGIVGFSAFLAWYLVMWASARFLRHETEPLYRMVGWAGLFVLVAFITEGFSIDTFALPYLWVSLGIVSAVAAAARQEHKRNQDIPKLS